MRYRRRGSPLLAFVISGVVLSVMTVIFLALGVQEFQREHDNAWSYEPVAFVNCHYDHTHKGTSYYDCQVGDPGTRAVIYDGTVSVSTSSYGSAPSGGSKWLHRIDGQVDDVGSRFPLWVEFFLVIPVVLFIGSFAFWRRSRRRKLAGYGGSTPGGFGGFGPPGAGPQQGFTPSFGQPGPSFGQPGPSFGQPVVTDQPQYPGPAGH